MTVKINADTSDGLKFVSDTSGTVDIQSNGTTVGTFDSTGLEVTSTSAPCDLTIKCPNNSGNSTIFFGDTDDIDVGIIEYGHTHNDLGFYTNTNRAMLINSSGQLLLGTSSLYGSSNALIHVNVDKIATDGGAVMSECTGTGDVFHYHFRNGNGGVGGIKTTGSSSAFVTSSDYRLKENVSYTWDATTRLKQLKPARFNFKSDTDTTLDGFLAHEVSSIVPEAIHGTKDATKVQNVYDEDNNKTGTETVPDYQGIDQSKLVPLLVKTIQELEARITALES